MSEASEGDSPMSVGEQLLHGVVKPPAALFLLPSKAWVWLLVYLLLAAGVLGGFAGLLIANQDELKQLFLDYFMPKEWHAAADIMLAHFGSSLPSGVLVSALTAGGLVLVGILLFHPKEQMSRIFEEERDLTGEPVEEHPLLKEMWEEIKLALLYVTAFMVIFWLGYHPDTWRKVTAEIISHTFLAFTFAVDFIGPTLMRHRMSYSQIIKAIFKRPLASFLFGALFAAPTVIVGHFVMKDADMGAGEKVMVIFGVEVLVIVWAAVGGTWLGAKLLPVAKQQQRSSVPVRILAWVALLGTFGANAYVFANLGSAVHAKSQVLKLEYDVDWGSLSFDTPSLSGLLGGKVKVGVGFDLQITNPTDFDVAIEKNRLLVEHGETKLAETRIDPMEVPSGETVEERVQLTLELSPTAALKGAALLKDEYKVVFYIQITDDIEFPIYIKYK